MYTAEFFSVLNVVVVNSKETTTAGFVSVSVITAIVWRAAKNRTLQNLDLGWNHLRMSGAVAIGKSLTVRPGQRANCVHCCWLLSAALFPVHQLNVLYNMDSSTSVACPAQRQLNIQCNLSSRTSVECPLQLEQLHVSWMSSTTSVECPVQLEQSHVSWMSVRCNWAVPRQLNVRSNWAFARQLNIQYNLRSCTSVEYSVQFEESHVNWMCGATEQSHVSWMSGETEQSHVSWMSGAAEHSHVSWISSTSRMSSTISTVPCQASAADDIVTLVTAHARSAPSVSYSHNSTCVGLVWHRSIRTRRVERRPLPFPTHLPCKWAMLWCAALSLVTIIALVEVSCRLQTRAKLFVIRVEGISWDRCSLRW